MTEARQNRDQEVISTRQQPVVFPRAVFAGFFTLGRKPTAIQKLIFSLADEVIAPSIFLVADAHFCEKLHAYIRGNLDDRLLPSAPDTDVLEVFFEDLDGFDSRDYEHGVSMLRMIDPALLELVSGLDWNGRHPASQHTRRRFESFVRTKVVPSLVRRRLSEYGASLKRVRVFSQRGIQQSAFRVSSDLPSQDPRRRIFLEGLRRGGLMFNFFNELVQQGVTSCTHFCVGRFGSLFVEAEESLAQFLASSPEYHDLQFSIQGLPFRSPELHASQNPIIVPDQRSADFVALGRSLSLTDEKGPSSRRAA